jgi:hypothetical protein
VSGESLDAEAKRLFEACRSEQPSAEARQRVLLAVPGDTPRRGRWLASVLALVAASAILAVALRARWTPAPSIRAERLVASPPHSVPAAVTSTPPVLAEPSPPGSSPTPSRRPSNPRQPKASTLTLQEETQALERVRAALAAGKPDSALAELDAYQKVANGGSLALEAVLLRIQALARTGRAREASELARSFIAANPNSPLGDRARRYLVPPGSEAQRPVETTETNGRNEP